ncbi:capsular polysaccharide biosynthesis protein [Ectobacillus antri]|uniref:capsular polysaccharide export protein, LipB/KpsS family n=1 Tax=Ectobacillus antri TaxID=2486280 RepID=UPI000F595645|nr:capsular polysaccharide biosynthesis protein [Ectobacillus antri]
MFWNRTLKVKVKKIRDSIMQIAFVIKLNPKANAFVFGVSTWKQNYMRMFLADYEVCFVPGNHVSFLLAKVISRYKDVVFISWGFNEDESVRMYAQKHNIPIYRIEDGFVRSIGLGAMHTPPFSLCLDKTGMYFDSTGPSDLEHILNTYNFHGNPELLLRAQTCMRQLTQLGLSKYNHVGKQNVEELYGPKTKRRILVVGQVEDDASIRKGSAKQWTNFDLVQLAYNENPDGEIIYKPHPDVLTGRRPGCSNIEDIRKMAKVVEAPLSLDDSFQTIDHVYTITSLSGFEALMRGISVTTIGAPFYSGWGLTDDRQPVARRKRKLAIEELFAGAYLLYPRYADPFTGEVLTLEDTIQKLIKQKEDM